jgi:hypothetical protein
MYRISVNIKVPGGVESATSTFFLAFIGWNRLQLLLRNKMDIATNEYFVILVMMKMAC